MLARKRGSPWRDLALSASSGRTHVVVVVKETPPTRTRKQLLHFLLAGVPYIKHAVVVDDDANVQDAGDVEWAIATRVQGDADLVIISNLRARSIDPSKRACSPPRSASTRPCR